MRISSNSTLNVIIILVFVSFLMALSGCTDKKLDQEEIVIADQVEQDIEAASCLNGLNDVLCKIRNESERLDISKSVSMMVCSDNYAGVLSGFDASILTNRTMVDIIHVWLFYLSKQPNIDNIENIAEFSSEKVYRTTSLDKSEVKAIMLKFLGEDGDDDSYPDDLALFKGRDKKIVLGEAATESIKAYFENLIVFDEAKKASDCDRITATDFRDELLLDACKLLFVDDLDVYCSTMI